MVSRNALQHFKQLLLVVQVKRSEQRKEMLIRTDFLPELFLALYLVLFAQEELWTLGS